MTGSLIIFLHGVGSIGAALLPLGAAWQAELPDAEFDAPDAPHPFNHRNLGRQWFSVSGVTEANRLERITEARPSFDAVLAEIIDRHGFGNRLDRVVLVGFSQGSIMALDAVASGRWKVGAVVAFSGRLATPVRAATANKSSILLVHGSGDHVVPPAESRLASEALKAAGHPVQHVELPGGHEISQAAALLGLRFAAGALDNGGPDEGL
jgi:phospholipase/carboxylesterase